MANKRSYPLSRRYGWKPSPPDFRDFKFAAAPHVLATRPVRVDLRNPALPAPFEPNWDQGDLGSCGPHAAGRDIVFAAFRQDRQAKCPMPSRLGIYWAAREQMGTIREDSGVDNRAMMKGLAARGWWDETLQPYRVRDFKKTPSKACLAQGATRRLPGYLSVPQTLDQMCGCLAQGDPFIFGFTVYESFESNQTALTGTVTMPRRNEAPVGGHDVLIDGYDDARRLFSFINPWGKWGEGGTGRGWMPYEYAIDPHLSGDFWTVRHAGLTAA